MEQKENCVGFIGAGNMALALISGILKSGVLQPHQIWASAPTMRSLFKVKELGCNITHSNTEVVQNCLTIILCVKPVKVQEATKEIRLEAQFSAAYKKYLLISVVSGVEIKTLEQILGEMKVVRAIPNLANEIHAGVFVYALGSRLSQCEKIRQLFGPLGLCEQVPEEQIDVVCGLCGSGLAYIFTVIQAMSDGALKMGLPRALATKLAAQTVLGASKMVLETGKHPAVLTEEVSSPAGTTINGLHALERAGVRSAFMDAVEAATLRARDQNAQSKASMK